MIDELFLDGQRIHDHDNISIRSLELGSPAPRQVLSNRPAQHGAIDMTSFYAGRTIEIEGDVYAQDWGTFWQAVDLLKGAFALNGQERVMTFKRTGFFESEMVTCRVSGAFAMPLNLHGPMAHWSVSVHCEDPRLYAANATVNAYDPLKPSPGGLSFPLDFPLVFAGGSTGPLKVLQVGTIESPVTWVICGPVTDPIIENETTGSQIVLANDIAEGQAVEIDTKARTLRLGTCAYEALPDRTISISPTVRPDWIDPELTEWGNLEPGQNTIRLQGDGMEEDKTALIATFRTARI